MAVGISMDILLLHSYKKMELLEHNNIQERWTLAPYVPYVLIFGMLVIILWYNLAADPILPNENTSYVFTFIREYDNVNVIKLSFLWRQCLLLF